MPHHGAAEHEGGDGHKFDEDVDGRSASVFHGITDGVADDSILVSFRAFNLHFTLDDEALSFDILLGVIPSSA